MCNFSTTSYSRFPILNTAKIPKKTFQEGGKYPIDMANFNWMLKGLIKQYEGVDGLKTGTTPEGRLFHWYSRKKWYAPNFCSDKSKISYGTF